MDSSGFFKVLLKVKTMESKEREAKWGMISTMSFKDVEHFCVFTSCRASSKVAVPSLYPLH